MLSDVYFDTYKQYERGTKQVVQWLASTTCYKQTSANKPLLKSPQQAQPAIRVPVDTLPHLAAQAAELSSNLPVPKSILQTLERVIRARKECAAAHQREVAGAGRSTSDLGHQYFLDVLKQVQNILLSARPTCEPPNDQNATPVQRAESVVNLFEHLDLHAPDDVAVTAGDIPLPTSSTNATREKGRFAEPEYYVPKSPRDEIEESIFASRCFLQDFERIRKYLRDLWVDYRHKKVSLTVATITTNMAFDTIERLHRTLSEDFPRCKTYEDLSSLTLGLDVDKLLSLEIIGGLGDAVILTDSLPGRQVYVMLRQMRDALQQRKFVDFSKEQAGYDWTRLCANDTPARTHRVVAALIGRLIPDMIGFALGIGGVNRPVDQLTCYIFKFYQSHEITIPLVFAGEILVDILFELGSDASMPFTALQDSTRRASASLGRYDMNVKLVLECDRTDLEIRERSLSLKQYISNFVDKDIVADWRSETGKLCSKGLTPWCLLKHHPVLCGMLRFHFDDEIYYMGLCMTYDWMCVMPVLHVYNAARQRGHLLAEWPDLEAIIKFYGAAHIFIGERTTRPQDFRVRLFRALGFSASATKRELRKQGHKDIKSLSLLKLRSSPEPARGLNFQTPVLRVMRSRLKERGKEDASIVLRDAEQAVTAVSKSRHIIDDNTQRILQQWSDTHLLDPLELLGLIRRGVAAEDCQLQFNFVDFNVRCILLLKRIRDDLQKLCPAAPLINNRDLYDVAQMVLYHEEPGNGPLLMVHHSPEGTSKKITPLQLAGQHMRIEIEKKGAEDRDKAEALCPGFKYIFRE
ncbi:hypothetical protein LTR09_008058 [Extremus antarcticus]|uniref:DUF6604 domain-containing protein n=1 Tax=Extremus antarcticus TaxID=702011 RepID=A0AAJ0DB60_9PEZI|nr:hypothetical protein LTR09_008058 [Extremus antarcticus]